jgi:hypothetical protein
LRPNEISDRISNGFAIKAKVIGDVLWCSWSEFRVRAAAIGEQPGIGHFRKALLTPRRDGEPGCGNEKCMQRGSHGNPFREIPIVTPAVFVQGVAR